MKIQRYNTICSIPGIMEQVLVDVKGKKYDASIVDKSCYSPLSEQLKGIQPMTPSEVEQHYHFIDGKDTGMKPPLPPSADIAEISNAIREGQKAVKKTIDKAVEKTKLDIENKKSAEAVLNQK